jgi:hypothetical protein
MPRAALLSIHAPFEDAEPSTWEDPSLVQLWGPRFSVFVAAAADVGVFTLGTLPDEPRRRQRAEDLAARIADVLGGTRADMLITVQPLRTSPPSPRPGVRRADLLSWSSPPGGPR